MQAVTSGLSLLILPFIVISIFESSANGQVLNKREQLEAQKFWDNRDWDWYEDHIPFFECPDADITTTYYYRWELMTKHLTYGSPNSGYSFTEFIDRPFWSGAYGAISCPAGHQLYEARWLKSPTIANDYTRYWFRTPGAQPRNYSTWLADSAWAVNQIHRDDAFVIDLLPDLIRNYEGWEQRHFVPEVGLFWQTGHDDGMEFNINSRQTKDILRGAPSYRPSFNAYMWADAVAIARIARLAEDEKSATRFQQKADALKSKIVSLLWDDKRQFFFPVYKNDEERDGHHIKALTKTYESGQFAGDPHGRELIGYVPWQFNLPERGKGFESAWAKLMDRDGFFAEFGPSTVERNDPMFLLQKSCCWWSGQSWPYATTQTLKALANLLQQDASVKTVSKSDYLKLLQIYARSHRKNGKPYLAEALHPDTGSFDGHDGYNHSEHYFHSGFCDLIITGLVGISPREDGGLDVNPLAPADWDFFAMDDVPFRGHRCSVVWDKSGKKYQVGAGFHLLLDGKVVASSAQLELLTLSKDRLSKSESTLSGATAKTKAVNFVVNNDGTYYPRVTATYSSAKSSISKVNDGNYWYLQHPPNRWTCEGSPNDADSILIEFGVPRSIHTVKVYVLDDENELGSVIRSPQKLDVEVWAENSWKPIQVKETSAAPAGHRPVVLQCAPTETTKMRVTMHHHQSGKSGLTEIEAWGDAVLPLDPPPPPAGNLAYNPNPTGFPKASASFTDRFGGKPHSAIDGKTVFLPSPMNRWTSYESKSKTDWLEIDFGQEVEFRRMELAIYDDRGGVQPPETYVIEYWTGSEWRQVANVTMTPEHPIGSQWNTVRFDPVKSSKTRIVFTHKGQARSGVSEVLIWNQ